MKIDIAGMSKAEALCRLWNGEPNSTHHGRFTTALQLLQKPMSIEAAERWVSEGSLYFDYVEGRALKVDLSGDVLDARLYDRDRSPGAASRALGRPPLGEEAP